MLAPAVRKMECPERSDRNNTSPSAPARITTLVEPEESLTLPLGEDIPVQLRVSRYV